MRKEDVASYIVYLLMIVIAVILGFTVLRQLVGYLDGTIPGNLVFLFSAGVVILAIVINAILIEVGHLIGAKAGGYLVTSFNILWFCFYKEEKWKFGFKSFDGLTGETKILPKNEKSNPKLYAWFPIIIYIFELIIMIVLITVIFKNKDLLNPLSWLLVSAFIFACVGGLIVLYDYVPLRLDSLTDGYRISLFGKKINIDAFNRTLLIEHGDIKDEEALFVYDEMTDFTAQFNLNKVYVLLADEKYEESIELINKIIENPKLINVDTHSECVALLVYAHFMNDSHMEAVRFYSDIDSNMRKAIMSVSTTAFVRAYILVSALVEESKVEMNFAISKKAKLIKRLPLLRQPIEEKLFEKALNKIKLEKPSFFEKGEEN